MQEKEKNNFYPVFLNVTHKHILMIGAGKVAFRKLQTLILYNPFIHIIAKEILPEIHKLAEHNPHITLEKRAFEEKDFFTQNYFLVFSAISDDQINQQIYQKAKEHNLLLNNANGKDQGSFIVPSSIQKKGGLQIAISSGGTSPLLSKLLKKEIENMMTHIEEDFTQFLEKSRKIVKQHIPHPEQRIKVFNNIIEDPILYNHWKQYKTFPENYFK